VNGRGTEGGEEMEMESSSPTMLEFIRSEEGPITADHHTGIKNFFG
jgi:hypothetical protein